MFDILRALEYLHSMKPQIIHRDIKPENILINKKVLQIADFGWSNENDNTQVRNTFCGTPDYLAPEMILGNGHNEKLDMWTVGILMYELLHGKPPFTPKSKKSNRRLQQREIEKNILNGNIEFEKSISRDSKEVMISLLNGNKDLRPGANQVLEFPYFAKRRQYLNKKFERQSERSISSNALENENKDLKKKLEEMENRLKEKEISLNNATANSKNMQKKNLNLEKMIKKLEMGQRGSRRYLKGTYNSSVGVVNNSSQRGKYFEESLPKKGEKNGKSRSKKLENEKLKRENKTLKEQNVLNEMKLKKLGTDLKFMETELKNSRALNIKFFDKHKNLSTSISNFYLRHYMENSGGGKIQEKLDFDDMFKKLEKIFEEFKNLKFRLSRPSENRGNYIETSNAYSISSQNKGRLNKPQKQFRIITDQKEKTKYQHHTPIQIWKLAKNLASIK